MRGDRSFKLEGNPGQEWETLGELAQLAETPEQRAALVASVNEIRKTGTVMEPAEHPAVLVGTDRGACVTIRCRLLWWPLVMLAACGPSPSQPPPASRPGMVLVESSSPYYEKLAAIHYGGGAEVPQEVVDAFRERTAKLEQLCPDAPEHIGDMLVAAQRQLKERGHPVSLLLFTDDLVVMLTEAKSSGGSPPMKSCSEPITLAVMAGLGHR